MREENAHDLHGVARSFQAWRWTIGRLAICYLAMGGNVVASLELALKCFQSEAGAVTCEPGRGASNVGGERLRTPKRL